MVAEKALTPVTEEGNSYCIQQPGVSDLFHRDAAAHPLYGLWRTHLPPQHRHVDTAHPLYSLWTTHLPSPHRHLDAARPLDDAVKYPPVITVQNVHAAQPLYVL